MPSSGARRIDDPADFVRLEIASALKRNIPVVPVLVQGAKMPTAAQLPAGPGRPGLAQRRGAERMRAGRRTCRCWRSRWPARRRRRRCRPRRAAASRRTAPIVGAAAVVAAAAALLVVCRRGRRGILPAARRRRPAGRRAERDRASPRLIAQMNDAEMAAAQRRATARMLAEHRQSTLAVELAVDQLSEASFQRLGEGRPRERADLPGGERPVGLDRRRSGVRPGPRWRASTAGWRPGRPRWARRSSSCCGRLDERLDALQLLQPGSAARPASRTRGRPRCGRRGSCRGRVRSARPCRHGPARRRGRPARGPR